MISHFPELMKPLFVSDGAVGATEVIELLEAGMHVQSINA